MHAVVGAIAAKFRAAGQTCVCANRLLIHSSRFEEFKEKLVEQVERLVVSTGLEAFDDGREGKGSFRGT